MDELKSCPFCGGKARFAKKGNITSGGAVGFTCLIECEKCKCTPCKKAVDITIVMSDNGEFRVSDAGVVARENLIYIWNQRAGEQK